VSLALTRWLVRAGISPNQITLVVLGTGLLGAWLASVPTFGHQLAGAALYQLHSILDGCDGELARLTRRFGRHGALFDSAVDDFSNVAFFVGLSIGVGRSSGATWPFIACAVTVLSYVAVAMLQYGFVRGQRAAGDKNQFWGSTTGGRSLLVRTLGALFRRDVFVLLILVAVALGQAGPVVAVLPFAGLLTLTATVVRCALVRAGAVA
jgi:phosphatidylglycerophosphate synthase